MLMKFGVDISRLRRPIRRALPHVTYVYQEQCDEEPVITSTYEGDHGEDSLHYADLAIDVRNTVYDAQRPVVFHQLKGDLQKAGYDVVQEQDHIHIEYDPH